MPEQKKILVTYASRTGYTAGVAGAIQQCLAENGISADCCAMKDVKDVSIYLAVVAGSGVQDRQWLPEAIQFVQTNQKILQQKPFAAFMVCMTLAMPNGEKYRQEITKWLNPVRKLVKPVSEGFFAGGLSLANIPKRNDRIKFRLSILFGIWKEGDHRNREAIREWAMELKQSLTLRSNEN